jgi:hypothetical protein
VHHAKTVLESNWGHPTNFELELEEAWEWWLCLTVRLFQCEAVEPGEGFALMASARFQHISTR